MKNFLLTLWYFPLQLWYNYKSWKWEQRCIKYFGTKPEEIYLSPENFDALQKRLAEPPDPEQIESLRKLMNRKVPWED